MKINGQEFKALTVRELRDFIARETERDASVLNWPVHFLAMEDDEAENARYATTVELDAFDYEPERGDPDVDPPVWCLSLIRDVK